MANIPTAPRSREEDEELTWEEFVQVMVVFEDLYEKDYSKITLRKWYDSITPDMGRELFQVTANVWMERRKWMPKIPEFKRLGRRIMEAQRALEAKRRAEARDRRERARMAREAREELPNALLEGKRIARAVKAGEFDLDAHLGKALPADVEESYENAGDVEEP